MFGASADKIYAKYELSIVSNTFLKKINTLKPNISANAYLVSTDKILYRNCTYNTSLIRRRGKTFLIVVSLGFSSPPVISSKSELYQKSYV